MKDNKIGYNLSLVLYDRQGPNLDSLVLNKELGTFDSKYVAVKGDNQNIYVFSEVVDNRDHIREVFIIREDSLFSSLYIFDNHDADTLKYIDFKKLIVQDSAFIVRKYKMRTLSGTISYVYWNNSLGLIAIEHYGSIYVVDKNTTIDDNKILKAVSDAVLDRIVGGWSSWSKKI